MAKTDPYTVRVTPTMFEDKSYAQYVQQCQKAGGGWFPDQQKFTPLNMPALLKAFSDDRPGTGINYALDAIAHACEAGQFSEEGWANELFTDAGSLAAFALGLKEYYAQFWLSTRHWHAFQSLGLVEEEMLTYPELSDALVEATVGEFCVPAKKFPAPRRSRAPETDRVLTGVTLAAKAEAKKAKAPARTKK